jgi:predicted aldo/keto reductase-like oxidoreductase
MIRYAIDNGVNYVDTAYPYHMGNSERVIGKAFQDGYRDKVRIATKLPVPQVQTAADFDTIFSEQLRRLQTDMIDFYLMHGLNSNFWPKVRDLGVLNWAENKMATGQIGYLGFSFHDEYDVFTKIVDDYDNWTLCQLQYNYVDVDSQAGRRGVEYAAHKGMAIVVMEPIRGGLLAKKPPESVAKAWGNTVKKRNLAELALQWVWNQPEISVALSGMSTMQQVMENLTFADRSHPGLLTPHELEIFKRVREKYRALKPIPCTGCNYCQPCPSSVEISRIFNMYNEVIMYDEPLLGYLHYASPAPISLKENQRADKCQECGQCEENCPQHIPVQEWLKKAHEKLMPRDKPSPRP